MPIYTYECTYCGWREEYLEPVDAPKEKHDLHPCVCSREPVGCNSKMVRIPSVPGPPKFNCEMPTYQPPKRQ